jgi:hypothetical protein
MIHLHPVTDAPAAPAEPDPVTSAFAGLQQALATSAIAAQDAGDEAGFTRGLAYRRAIRAILERWTRGDASPIRNAAEKAEKAAKPADADG